MKEQLVITVSGSELREMRERLHMTQQDVADGASLSVQAISRFERGVLKLRLDSLARIGAFIKAWSY